MQQFILDVTPDAMADVVTLRLSDPHGLSLGYNQVRLADHPTESWEALFDPDAYVKRCAGNLTAAERADSRTKKELLAELGVFLAKVLLGEEIIRALRGSAQWTLLVRLTWTQDPLTAGLARPLGDHPRVGEQSHTGRVQLVGAPRFGERKIGMWRDRT